MPYVAMSDLTGMIPSKFLAQAMDKDGDGRADEAQWQQVATDAEQQVNGIIGVRYALPLATVPDCVKFAAKAFAAEAIYVLCGREGAENPWASTAGFWRKTLLDAMKNALPISTDLPKAHPAVEVIGEPAVLGGGGLMS